MEKIEHAAPISPFNGALETGIRAVMVLHASYPKTLDVQRLTAMDYLVVRTSLLDGPTDLHPASPTISPVTQVRRKYVQDSLNLMMSRELISQCINDRGIRFIAGECSTFFVDALQTTYLRELYDRAYWLSCYFQEYNDAEFDRLMNQLLENWVSEFQDEADELGLSR